ncbi:MAG TPA: hypothetical protein VGR67_11805 [Candidatus Polarisedimenticolia bacterium]|jgi:uncharacterized repeat protein (TIGR01451 family)|nr:hypothetical protein [Candidatus Polarisedimenticolia bacterium]
MPHRLRPLDWATLLAALPYLLGGAGGGAFAAAPAGASIANRASAAHDVASGGSAASLSNTALVGVAPVSAISVTPDDAIVSGFVPSGATVVRHFTVTNLGNRGDRFQVTASTVSPPATLTGLFFDLDGNGAIDPTDPAVTPGLTLSPPLPPAASLGVLFRYSSAGVPSGTVVVLGLAAQSQEPGAVNGLATDAGAIRDQVGGGAAAFSDPANPGQPPAKRVDGQSGVNAARGQEVTFSLEFANSGTGEAANAAATDTLPAGFLYVPGSLRLDGSPLSDAADGDAGEVAGEVVTVRFASVAPGESHRIEFHARIDPGTAPATLLSNLATFTAAGTAPVDSNAARVLVDPFGLIFQAGGGLPVSGALVSLWSDSSGTLQSIPPLSGAGATPNVDNTNPFAADTAGRFSFLPDPAAGAAGAITQSFLRVVAPGFLPRLIRVDLAAASGSSPSAPVFTLTLTAADGLPLALPGSFSLTSGPVVLSGVSAFGFNVPVFSASPLIVTKVADSSHARVSESVGYRVQVTNPGVVPVSGVSVTDTLPEFLDVVEGAARRISAGIASPIVPAQSGRTLVFALGDLPPGGQAEISYRARIAPGAPAAALSNEAVASGLLPTGDPAAGGPARAVVFVRQGIFSFQQALIGRVFEDRDGNGRFDAGEAPLPGIRVVLDNGMSATTDSEGLYSLPSVPEGARMIGLDPSTYPPGLCPADPDRLGDRGSVRLLRTPLRGGALLKQNFSLTRRGDCPERPPSGEEAATARSTARAGAAPPAAPAAAEPGVHVREQTETLPSVPPGAFEVLEPADQAVSPTGALDLTVRTHRRGALRVSVNDHTVEADRLGQTELDDKNQLATFHYVGIPILPGPNRVSITALTGDGGSGDSREILVYGRGAAEKIRISVFERELPADGRSATEVRVDLLDAWDHPAQDSRVRILASLGSLRSDDAGGRDRDVALATHGGAARLQLVSDPSTGTAHLRAEYGDLSDETAVVFLPAPQPAILVGLAEATLGAASVDPGVGKDAGTIEDGAHGRVAFFYKGGVALPGALLTAAYDSDRRLNRTADSDRLFDLDPLEQTYPVMGDSSTHFQEAASNSRAYLKLERERSHLLYGDFDPGMGDTRLSAYHRKLTGLELNLEDRPGDRIALAAARPDNAFAREVIPAAGIGGLYRLRHAPLIPGSESVALEVHDRRNPEEVLSRQILLRGTDYDLDPLAATLLFKRPIGSFAGDFDLVEIVVLYEYEAAGFDSLSWAARGIKKWNGGKTSAGLSAFGENPEGGEDFRLVAADLLQQLPGPGTLSLEAARSDGRPLNQGNASLGPDPAGAGAALRLEYAQRLAALRGPLKLAYQDVDADFVNPYGVSIAPGSRRILLGAEPALTEKLRLGVTLQDEKNRTAVVDNARTTGSLRVTAQVSGSLGLTGGLDHRDFEDRISDRRVASDLLTAGASFRPAPRWTLSARREQNVGSESDPSYPDSTFLAAGFQQNQEIRYFLKFRDSDRPIEAIADLGAAGLTPPRSRSELQLGAESRLGAHSTLTSRYQVENGISGTDSYAVVGLGTRLPVDDQLSVDFRGEAGFRVAGEGDSFESLSTGLSWIPRERFKTTMRYELRNADGFGQTFTAAAIGKPGDDVTLLARLDASDASQRGQDTTIVNFFGGLALRPLKRDDYGVLIAWKRSDRRHGSNGPGDDVRTLRDTLSADGVFDLTPRARFFARAALSFTTDTPAGLPSVDTTTTLLQSRLEYRLGRRWDAAGEIRDVTLWQDRLRRRSLGLEAGFWATEDLRVGCGYGLTGTRAVEGDEESFKRGFYLNLTTKLNRILELIRENP